MTSSTQAGTAGGRKQSVGRAPQQQPASQAAPEKSPHVLPPLPYAEDALQPVISATTLAVHHGKHHKTYVDTLNELVAGTPLAALTLEALILQTAGRPEHVKVFNNAAQAWNHSFYWHCLAPNGGGNVPAGLSEKIKQAFGSVARSTAGKLAGAAVAGKGIVLRSAWTSLADKSPNGIIRST